MIVVADTTPLNHLGLVGEIDILRDLYGKLIIPEEVFNELQAENTPQHVKDIIANADWIEVKTVQYVFDIDLDVLDLGERSAIVLAEQITADYLLIDEKLGRRVALDRGLKVIGTLATVKRAEEKGMLDFPTVLSKLKANDFYISKELEEFFLKQ